MKKIVFAATAALFAFGATAAMAQSTAPSTTAPKVTAPVAKAPAAPSVASPSATSAATVAKGRKVATTEIGKQCSAEADAQSLKGKPRQAFRAKCKKAAMAKKN
jgi:psiF repeat